jgi:hypothetical protein
MLTMVLYIFFNGGITVAAAFICVLCRYRMTKLYLNKVNRIIKRQELSSRNHKIRSYCVLLGLYHNNCKCEHIAYILLL